MKTMDEGEKMDLGTTLRVPNVQELAKKHLPELPPRYVHPGQEPPADVHDPQTQVHVPIIDLQRLLSDEFSDSELHKLNSACTHWGFFQLVCHGVDEELLEKVRMETQRFFNLPAEEKAKYEQLPDEVEGYGQAFVVSEDQKLDWADMFYMTILPVSMRKSHLLPKLPQPFRDAIENYSSELKHLSVKILDMLSKGLKMDNMYLKDLFEGGAQSMRFNYYPPCPYPELAVGLTPHSDPSGFTILRFHDLVFFVCSLCKITIVIFLQIVSNGTYRSIEHRGIVNSENERLSLATFFMPRLDAEMSPAPSIITPENPESKLAISAFKS